MQLELTEKEVLLLSAILDQLTIQDTIRYGVDAREVYKTFDKIEASLEEYYDDY